MFGYTEEEILQMGVEDIHPKDSLEDVLSDFEAQERGEKTLSSSLPCLHKDGTIFYANISTTSMELNGVKCKVGFFTDITELRRAKEVLERTKDFAEGLIETAQVIILVLDISGRIVSINPYMERISGYRFDEVKGKDWFHLFMPKRDREKIRRLFLDAVSDIQIYGNINPILTKCGQEVYIEWNVKTLKDKNGDASGILSIGQDITSRMQAKHERKILQERLQRAEKMEALGILAGGVAHDLNNALGILVGYSELLYTGMDESDPLREDARNIMYGGERAAAIVQDLLTLARRGVQNRASINLNDTISDYINTPEFKKLTELHPNIRLRTKLYDRLLKINGSKVHLSKTLANLVSNAAEAMTSGGELIINTKNLYVDKPVSGYDDIQEGDYVVLSVSDEGEGIAEHDLRRVFEPFYTKKVMGKSGTGLGLSVVWGTVKDHEGYIDIQSSIGKGTTFTLYFPVTREETSEEIPTLMDEYMGRGETILIVDDIKQQRDLAMRILKDLNYRVDSVSSGEEALVYLMETTIDLIVLDMIMEPGIDGLETYRQISKIRPRQKAIIVSGYAETQRVKIAQSLGAGTFVRKPYIRERIGLAVRNELDS